MRFSIRDLLLVTIIVALALGWRVDRTKLARVIEVRRLEKIRVVLWNHSQSSGGLHFSPPNSDP
jgi:hypothetical protein